MSRKYAQLDKQLFAWLEETRDGITTRAAYEALGATENAVQRHINRRISQLRAKNILSCTTRGTARVCTLIQPLPETLAKPRWIPGTAPRRKKPARKKYTSIPATNSEEFVANGGTIERLPAAWD